MTEFVLKKRSKVTAPFFVLYGGPGEGKTTLANSFPDPLFMRTEPDDNQEQLTLKDGVFETYDEFIEGMKVAKGIIQGEGGIATIVIDTVDYLETLIQAKVDDENSEMSIWDKKRECHKLFARVIKGLQAIRDTYGIAIVLIAHEKIVRAEDLTTPKPYDRHIMAVTDDRDDSNLKLLKDQADAIGFLKRKITQDEKTGRGVMSDKPSLYLSPGGAWDAKNRYRQFGMPKKFDNLPEEGWTKLAPFIPFYKGMVETKTEEQTEE